MDSPLTVPPARRRPAACQSLLVCEHCDSVYRQRPLTRGEVAECARCGAVLERYHGFSDTSHLALVVTGLVVFVEANAWPIVTLGLNGQHSSTTLWGVIELMWSEHAPTVAVICALTLFFCPLAKMLTLIWLLLFARSGRRAPGFRPLMVGLHYLGPWTMNEVFVLGMLVSIVKARAYFDVTPDPGIWAYGVLMFLITAVGGLDLRHLWRTLPRGRAS